MAARHAAISRSRSGVAERTRTTTPPAAKATLSSPLPSGHNAPCWMPSRASSDLAARIIAADSLITSDDNPASGPGQDLVPKRSPAPNGSNRRHASLMSWPPTRRRCGGRPGGRDGSCRTRAHRRPPGRNHAASGTHALRVDSITAVKPIPVGSACHSRSRSAVVVRNRRPLQANLPRSSARLA